MFLNCRIFQSCIHWIAAFGVFILMLHEGLSSGWAAPNIAKLKANDSTIQADDEQLSWIVSLSGFGGMIGAIVGALSVEFFGSRKSFFVVYITLAINWSCIIIANTVAWLYVSRVFSGLGKAANYCCFSLYLGEIADPKIRGTLISISLTGMPFGTVVGTIVETYLPMKVSSTMYLVVCLLGLALFLLFHDTPYYLVRISASEKAKKSIKFYHPKCDVEDQFVEVKSFVEANGGQSFRDKLQDILHIPVLRKALFIILFLFILPHFSGYMNVSSYIGVIIEKGKFNLIKSEQFVIYANIVSVVSNLLTFKFIDILGRRTLLIMSSVGTSIAMVGLGFHFLLLKNDVDADSLQWLPAVCLLGYLISYAIGYALIPAAVLSELFTDNIKSIAALLAALFASLFSFVTSKVYLSLVEAYGETYVFWGHAALGSLSIPFALLVLPETKGKTFQQIQDALIKI